MSVVGVHVVLRRRGPRGGITKSLERERNELRVEAVGGGLTLRVGDYSLHRPGARRVNLEQRPRPHAASADVGKSAVAAAGDAVPGCQCAGPRHFRRRCRRDEVADRIDERLGRPRADRRCRHSKHSPRHLHLHFLYLLLLPPAGAPAEHVREINSLKYVHDDACPQRVLRAGFAGIRRALRYAVNTPCGRPLTALAAAGAEAGGGR
mmetsp:Transcript_16875/g.41664  ORF Transcript_16875/g.41664 Transcript_16875/m.41664 type:complete len:207 (+) Transcript_16875:462-1082(+)